MLMQQVRQRVGDLSRRHRELEVPSWGLHQVAPPGLGHGQPRAEPTVCVQFHLRSQTGPVGAVLVDPQLSRGEPDHPLQRSIVVAVVEVPGHPVRIRHGQSLRGSAGGVALAVLLVGVTNIRTRIARTMATTAMIEPTCSSLSPAPKEMANAITALTKPEISAGSFFRTFMGHFLLASFSRASRWRFSSFSIFGSSLLAAFAFSTFLIAFSMFGFGLSFGAGGFGVLCGMVCSLLSQAHPA